MSTTAVKEISLQDLKAKLDRKEPLTLVNVLSEEWVRKTNGARIPGSHWIPVDEAEQRFPLLFAKDEDIVVYCGGPQCPASTQAAEKLSAIGFTNVRAYEGGLQEWKEAGYKLLSADVAKSASCTAESCGA